MKLSDEFDKEEEIIATNGETFPWDDLRLPKFIHPVRYDIELTPNLTSLWVKGISFLFKRLKVVCIQTLKDPNVSIKTCVQWLIVRLCAQVVS